MKHDVRFWRDSPTSLLRAEAEAEVTDEMWEAMSRSLTRLVDSLRALGLVLKEIRIGASLHPSFAAFFRGTVIAGLASAHPAIMARAAMELERRITALEQGAIPASPHELPRSRLARIALLEAMDGARRPSVAPFEPPPATKTTETADPAAAIAETLARHRRELAELSETSAAPEELAGKRRRMKLLRQAIMRLEDVAAALAT